MAIVAKVNVIANAETAFLTSLDRSIRQSLYLIIREIKNKNSFEHIVQELLELFFVILQFPLSIQP